MEVLAFRRRIAADIGIGRAAAAEVVDMPQQMPLARSASGRCRNSCRCPNRLPRSRRSADLRPARRAAAQSRARRAPRRAADRAPARASAAGSPRGGYRRFRGLVPAPTSARLRSRRFPMATGGSSTPPHARAYPRRSRRRGLRSVGATASSLPWRYRASNFTSRFPGLEHISSVNVFMWACGPAPSNQARRQRGTMAGPARPTAAFVAAPARDMPRRRR